MQLLKELLEMSKLHDISADNNKYTPQEEGVEDVVASSKEDYVDLPKPSGTKTKKKKKSFPTTDNAENSLINTLWYYQNADAS